MPVRPRRPPTPWTNQSSPAPRSRPGSSGRCERCEGAGALTVKMHFLPDVEVRCPACHGRRFKRETLAIKYRGHDISQALNMTVEEALELFADVPAAVRGAGTPPRGSAGSYWVRLRTTNTVSSALSSTHSFTVEESPAFTSAPSAESSVARSMKTGAPPKSPIP